MKVGDIVDNNLEKIMNEKRKTIRDIVRDLDIPQTSVFRMRKKTQEISSTYAKKLATYLNVSLDELLAFDGPPSAATEPIIKEVPPTYYNILAGLELCSISELEKIASIIDFLKHKKKVEAELPPNRKIVWGEKQDLPKDKK